MKRYELNVAGITRYLEFVDLDGGMAYASFVIMSDTEMIEAVGPKLAERIGDCDVIITAEAKGIALAFKISELLGHKNFVVARKSEKTYMKDVTTVEVKSITTANTQTLLLDGLDKKNIEGKRVCIVDDVVSTGGSLKALEELVERCGGKVVKVACVLAEGEAYKRDDIIYLEKLPLFKKVGEEYEVLE